MLTFLAVASKMGYVVDAYVDNAVGYVEKNDEGLLCVNRAVLNPEVTFGDGKTPDAETLNAMHEKAHKACFIANSIKTKTTVHG